VGYAGWSMLGGYGPFSSSYGLGVDQIVGAKVVKADGEVIDADNELLFGIRGAGGTLGVVVELTIKVYPVGKVCLLHPAYATCFQSLTIRIFFYPLLSLSQGISRQSCRPSTHGMKTS